MIFSEIKKEFKMIGLYVVMALAVLRFIVFPLHGAVASKKNAFNEYYGSYVLKYQLVEKSKIQQKKQFSKEHKTLSHKFYMKDVRFSSIQADIVELLIKLAEKKGMNVINFEILEPVVGKEVSEIPLLIRFEGKLLEFNEFLKLVDQSEKLLQVKSMEINRSTGQDMRYFLTINAFRVER